MEAIQRDTNRPAGVDCLCMPLRNRRTSRQRLALATFLNNLGGDARDSLGRHARLWALASIMDAHAKQRPATVASIARDLRAPRTTVMRLLSQLMARRLIVREDTHYHPRASALPRLRAFADRQLQAWEALQL